MLIQERVEITFTLKIQSLMSLYIGYTVRYGWYKGNWKHYLMSCHEVRALSYRRDDIF